MVRKKKLCRTLRLFIPTMSFAFKLLLHTCTEEFVSSRRSGRGLGHDFPIEVGLIFSVINCHGLLGESSPDHVVFSGVVRAGTVIWSRRKCHHSELI